MKTRTIDMQENTQLLQLVRDIEARQLRDQQSKKIAFWTGVAVGGAAVVGAGVAYNRYQNKKNQ